MLSILSTTRDDVPDLLTLIRGLATFEKKPHKAIVTEADLLRDGYKNVHVGAGALTRPAAQSAAMNFGPK